MYAHDEWTPTRRLTLTAGLRFDVPFLPTPPAQNPVLLSELGINTAITPDGNVLWSPRLGFNYDLSGRGTTFLRGGIGLFAGRPAYFWLRARRRRSGSLRRGGFGREAGRIWWFLGPGLRPTWPTTSASTTPVPWALGGGGGGRV
jgi:hypothetical protein